MTTLKYDETTITVLIKPQEYELLGIIAVGCGFCFQPDKQASDYFNRFIHNNTLFAIWNDNDAQDDCAYILTLGFGCDCSDEEAIVVLKAVITKDEV